MRLVLGAIFALSLPATSVRADTYDSWMMNWFRAPSINGIPACVPSHYDPTKTETLFRQAGNLKSYSVKTWRDGKVYIFTEVVHTKTGGSVILESVSDYQWCINHYQREYWRNLAEAQKLLAPDLKAGNHTNAPRSAPSPEIGARQRLAPPVTVNLETQDCNSNGAFTPAQSTACRLETLRRSRVEVREALARRIGAQDENRRDDLASLERHWEELQERECDTQADTVMSQNCEIETNRFHLRIVNRYY